VTAHGLAWDEVPAAVRTGGALLPEFGTRARDPANRAEEQAEEEAGFGAVPLRADYRADQSADQRSQEEYGPIHGQSSLMATSTFTVGA
jgi:hypothetical protein